MIRQAVILAGGEGTRLRPVTLEIPKPLVPVQGLPIATWQMRWLERAGVERVLVLIPPKWKDAFEAWKDHLQTKARVELWVEPEPMGTMGALVHSVRADLGSDPFFVTNGDELKGLDLRGLTEAHIPGHLATIALTRVPNPSDYGVAEMEGSRIVRFHEKPANPPSDLINSGLYILEPSALDLVSKEKRFLMFEKDLFPWLASEGRLGGCALEGPWYDCGTMERWEKAIKEWKEPPTRNG